MWAHVQRRGRCERQCHGYIRIFEDGQVPFVDPYRYSFAFELVEPDVIELTGVAVRGPTNEEVRALKEACRNLRWRVRFDRKCGASPGVHERE